jgi:hypothetical protein
VRRWRQVTTGAPKVLGFPNTAVLAATRPDVIITTGEVDDATRFASSTDSQFCRCVRNRIRSASGPYRIVI